MSKVLPADRNLTCAECTAIFIFTAGEQQYFKDHDLGSEPKRCAECRHRRRRKRDQDAGRPLKEEFDAVCNKCGRDTALPFAPRLNKPVFCRNCFGAEERTGKVAAAV